MTFLIFLDNISQTQINYQEAYGLHHLGNKFFWDTVVNSICIVPCVQYPTELKKALEIILKPTLKNPPYV